MADTARELGTSPLGRGVTALANATVSTISAARDVSTAALSKLWTYMSGWVGTWTTGGSAKSDGSGGSDEGSAGSSRVQAPTLNGAVVDAFVEQQQRALRVRDALRPRSGSGAGTPVAAADAVPAPTPTLTPAPVPTPPAPLLPSALPTLAAPVRLHCAGTVVHVTPMDSRWHEAGFQARCVPAAHFHRILVSAHMFVHHKRRHYDGALRWLVVEAPAPRGAAAARVEGAPADDESGLDASLEHEVALLIGRASSGPESGAGGGTSSGRVRAETEDVDGFALVSWMAEAVPAAPSADSEGEGAV
jgi:hypothetical protein